MSFFCYFTSPNAPNHTQTPSATMVIGRCISLLLLLLPTSLILATAIKHPSEERTKNNDVGRMSVSFNLVKTAFMALKTTELAVCDRWLSGDQILKLLKLKYDFHDCNDVSILVMARSLGSIGDINDGIQFNNSGFYRRKYTCLSKECIMFYYFQESTPPIFPNGRADWDKIKKESEEFDVESAISSPFKTRKANEFDATDYSLASLLRNKAAPFPEAAPHSPPSNAPSTCYWDSPNAKKLFQPRPNEKVLDCLDRRVNELSKAVDDISFSKFIIEEGDPESQLSVHMMESIQKKALYLRRAYEIAINQMDEGRNFEFCISEAINELQEVGFSKIRDSRAVYRYNIQFRRTELFPNHRNDIM
jgi:hypothetical protein